MKEKDQDKSIRALKYRLYPTSDQELFLKGVFDATRFVYNAAIEVYWQHYISMKAGGRNYNKKDLCLSVNDISKQLTELTNVSEFNWVKQLSISRANYLAIHDRAIPAWNRYWKNKKNGKIAKWKSDYLKRKRLGNGKVNLNKLRKIGQPKFKSKFDRQSFLLDQSFTIDLGLGELFIPKLKTPLKFRIQENDKIFRDVPVGVYKKGQGRGSSIK